MRETRDRLNLAALNKAKVAVYKGDLVLPNFTLLADDAAAMSGIVVAVIYNDADMSYSKTYASLRAANLQLI